MLACLFFLFFFILMGCVVVGYIPLIYLYVQKKNMLVASGIIVYKTCILFLTFFIFWEA